MHPIVASSVKRKMMITELLLIVSCQLEKGINNDEHIITIFLMKEQIITIS